MFNFCIQEQDKTFDIYLNKLRYLVKICKYGALEDELLCHRIVIVTSNNNVWARLLGESGLTLDQTTDICWSSEQPEQQLDRFKKSTKNIIFTKVDKNRHVDL